MLPARIASIDGESEVSASAKRKANALVRTARGFRGVYLNELDRRHAISWAMALAALLWDENVVTLRGGVAPHDLSRRIGPTVVVGYDERPASPDILTGVILGLRRMSCTVVDVGLTTEPCLAFAVHHLHAEAGIYVTGAGCEPIQIGFDVRLRHGLPPDESFLNAWEALQRQPIVRRSRSSGSVRAFPATVPYEANLWKHFHALRPLHVACGTSSSQLLARLERLFARLPGRFTPLKLPVRRRDLRNPDDPDVVRIANAVREQSAHFGVVIDDDAMAVAVLDERGQLVHSNRWESLIVRHLLREHGPGKVIVERGRLEGDQPDRHGSRRRAGPVGRRGWPGPNDRGSRSGGDWNRWPNLAARRRSDVRCHRAHGGFDASTQPQRCGPLASSDVPMSQLAAR